MSGRVQRCAVCRQTTDLATLLPELAVQKGRALTDEEYAEVLDGRWHAAKCPGEPLHAEGPRQLRTEYDWRTGKPR